MLIRFTKPANTDGKPVLTLVREDGSTTWQHSSNFFVGHDLTHFAVESELGFSEAFFGLIASGWSIEEFADKVPGSNKTRPLPEQALQAEVLVGLLDLQRAQGGFSDGELLGQYSELCASRGLPCPIAAEPVIEGIRNTRDALLSRWAMLDPGQVMELQFKPQK